MASRVIFISDDKNNSVILIVLIIKFIYNETIIIHKVINKYNNLKISQLYIERVIFVQFVKMPIGDSVIESPG